MNKLNASIPLPLPPRFEALPIDERGFPVPWFVGWVDDGAGGSKPDFRAIRPGGLQLAVRHDTCWLCGQKLGAHKAFVIGPMCAVNRTTSEPPSHLDCATFAAKACPFLTNPRMRRNEKDMPADVIQPAGTHLPRNPGAVAIWVTKRYQIFRVDNGYLIELGDPSSVTWWAEGRTATREEVEGSITSGLPFLVDIAKQQGLDALVALNAQLERAKPFLPVAA